MSFPSGHIVTADEYNVIFDSWATWTPTWTNLTTGNGTVTAKYRSVGKTVTYRLKFTLGTTSAVGTTPTFTLPVTPHAGYVFDDPFGLGDALDSGTASYIPKIRYNGSGVVRVEVTATSPFTFGNSDNFQVSAFTYEAA